MMLDSDQHQQISADCNPDLRRYGIDGVAKEILDG